MGKMGLAITTFGVVILMLVIFSLGSTQTKTVVYDQAGQQLSSLKEEVSQLREEVGELRELVVSGELEVRETETGDRQVVTVHNWPEFILSLLLLTALGFLFVWMANEAWTNWKET